jgi:hypothetical protein
LVLIEALKNVAGGCALINRETAKYAEEAYILPQVITDQKILGYRIQQLI